jgi:hypothetical protein
MALAVASQIEGQLGAGGKWIFLIGFWGAVFTSMIGVWHGVPYLFADFVYTKREGGASGQTSLTRTPAYKGYLAAMVILPMSLLVMQSPVWVVVAYAVTGAFFMPLLAVLLLYMNNQARWLSEQRSSLINKALMIFCLLLFGGLLFDELMDYL